MFSQHTFFWSLVNTQPIHAYSTWHLTTVFRPTKTQLMPGTHVIFFLLLVFVTTWWQSAPDGLTAWWTCSPVVFPRPVDWQLTQPHKLLPESFVCVDCLEWSSYPDVEHHGPPCGWRFLLWFFFSVCLCSPVDQATQVLAPVKAFTPDPSILDTTRYVDRCSCFGLD